MTVIQGEKGDPSPSYDGGSIYRLHQYFRLRLRHLKGSNRPAGYFHNCYGSDAAVTVRWLWTEDNGFFAPEITFRPSSLGVKTATKVGEALRSFGWHEASPDKLVELLSATVVEYIDDQKEGCWDDYRPLYIPGEPAMVTIARAAL
jgi:hypothetical protein